MLGDMSIEEIEQRLDMMIEEKEALPESDSTLNSAEENPQKMLTGGENGGIIHIEGFNPVSQSRIVPILRTSAESWQETLSSEEIRSIEKYAQNIVGEKPDNFFERINSMLRGDSPKDDKFVYYANNISSGLSKFILENDIICYRATDKNYFSDKEIGSIFSPGSFLSSSVVPKGALDKDFLTLIYAHKGSNGAYIENISPYKSQREFLFNNTCQYRVLSKSDKLMELEVII